MDSICSAYFSNHLNKDIKIEMLNPSGNINILHRVNKNNNELSVSVAFSYSSGWKMRTLYGYPSGGSLYYESTNANPVTNDSNNTNFKLTAYVRNLNLN